MAAQARVEAQRSGWGAAVRAVAAADAVVLLAAGLALRDKEAVVLAGIFLGGLLLLRLRSGIAGLVLLGLLSANVVVWMLPAAVVNVTAREELLDFMLPVSLAAISIASGVSAFLAILHRRDPRAGAGASRVVARHLAAVLVLAVVAGLVDQAGGGGAKALAGDLQVDIRGTSFSVKTLRTPAGTSGLFVANHDLFWHTFTVAALDLNINLPTGAERRVRLTAPPGSYPFVCRVPGHAAAGMEGTLVVG